MAHRSLARSLADYAVTVPSDQLPDDVVVKVKQRVLDSLACAIGAYDAPPVSVAIAVGKAAPVPVSTILGTDLKTTPDLAAFANGVMVRFLDYNDGYMAREPGHPSDTIPACLALAEARSVPGRELLSAIAIAYEVQMRLQDAASLNRQGWDHVNYVNVAVAAAAARLLHLDVERAEQAINLSLSGHLAMRQVRTGALSDWKGCSAANAARNALFSAQLAEQGLTGPSPIFEGEAGIFAQVTGPFDLDVQAFGRRKGDDFMINRSLTKTFPTNGELHTAVWAAMRLRERISDLGEIESILIETSEFNRRVLADPEKWRPTTRETADHSLPYNVARALLDGGIDLLSYAPERIADPQVLTMMDRTTVVEDIRLTDLFPRHLANRVTVTLRSGDRLVEEAISGPGSVETPMTDDNFEEKFHRMADPHLSAEAQEKVIAFIAALGEHSDYAPLFHAMKRDLARSE